MLGAKLSRCAKQGDERERDERALGLRIKDMTRMVASVTDSAPTGRWHNGQVLCHFERPLSSRDPNWTLVRVDAAEA